MTLKFKADEARESSAAMELLIIIDLLMPFLSFGKMANHFSQTARSSVNWTISE